MTQERNLSLRTQRKNLSLTILKRNSSLRTLKRTLSLRTLRSFRTLNDFCITKKSLFDFLVMVYDRVKRFYTKIFKFQTNIKIIGKSTLGMFLDFAYFNSYLQIKETALKRSDAIFSKTKSWLG